MASASSPAARASPLALAREREEQKKLWRVVDRTFTSLELGRRKWDKLSEQGKLALQRLVNSRSKLGYAHGPSWGALSGCVSLRRGVAISALTERDEAAVEIQRVAAALDAVVAEMQIGADRLCASTKGWTKGLGGDDFDGEQMCRMGARRIRTRTRLNRSRDDSSVFS